MEEKYEFNITYGDNSIKGTTYIMPANPEAGYNFGFAIYIPEGCEEKTDVMMYSPNTGGAGINEEGKIDNKTHAYHLRDGIEAVRQKSIGWNHGKKLGHMLNMPVITPLIPRVIGYYTHAMGSYVFNNDVSNFINGNSVRNNPDHKLSEEEIYQIQRYCFNLFDQVSAGLPDALNFLRSKGYEVPDKIIAGGYSAGSKFANCFTAVHPELVKAAFGGGIGGLMIIPKKSINVDGVEVELKYPLGFADLPEENIDAFNAIPQYYYMGDVDFNDPAEVIEIDGKLVARYGDCYSPEELYIIHNYLGDKGPERFDNVKIHYSNRTEFQKFHGDHISICSNNKDGVCPSDESVGVFVKTVLENEKDLGL